MRGTIALIAILAGLCAVSAFGALGDSTEQAIKRYGSGGKTVRFSQSDSHRQQTMRWEHFFAPDIEISFDDGIVYHVRIEGDLPPSKWEYYLQMNAQGQKWALISWSTGTYDEAEWRRADGAYAKYSNKTLDIIDARHKDFLLRGSQL